MNFRELHQDFVTKAEKLLTPYKDENRAAAAALSNTIGFTGLELDDDDDESGTRRIGAALNIGARSPIPEVLPLPPTLILKDVIALDIFVPPPKYFEYTYRAAPSEARTPKETPAATPALCDEAAALLEGGMS